MNRGLPPISLIAIHISGTGKCFVRIDDEETDALQTVLYIESCSYLYTGLNELIALTARLRLSVLAVASTTFHALETNKVNCPL